MNVFITGATGYIGSAVAKKLKYSGHDIFALARSDNSAETLSDLGYSVIKGDMLKPDAWKQAASQSDAFIHCAQIRSGNRMGMRWVKKALKTDQTAFKGLIDAAKLSSNCRALIYTSGVSVVGDYGSQWTDEETAPKPGKTLGSYHLQGEKLVNNAAENGLPAVILRPSLPISNGGTFAEFFLEKAVTGSLRYVGNGNNYFPTVHLDDLANAYQLALENPPAGETVIISEDDPLTIKEFSDTLMKQYGHSKAKSVSKWIISLLAGRPLANLLVSSYRVKNTKAKRILGWNPQYPTFRDSLNHVMRNN